MATAQLTQIPIIPNGKRYWVLAPKREKVTKQVGNFKLEETAEKKEPPLEGRVVAVGDATRREACTLDNEGRASVGYRDVKDVKYQFGDLVIFGKYAGNPHVVNGVEYLILHEDEILGHVIETPFDVRDTTDLTQ
jgi:chaperonin GroES